MKIRQKLFCGYLAITLVMGFAGYLSINIYNEIKEKVVDLKKNDVGIWGASEELIQTLQRSQESIRKLIENKPRIIYSYSYTSTEIRQSLYNRGQIEKQLQKDLKNLEKILSPFASNLKGENIPASVSSSGPQSKSELRRWLNLRKKHLYYHWLYLYHFINIVDRMPSHAFRFFHNILEPHYRQNVFPIIHKYREGERKQTDNQVCKIIDEYIPNANVVIIGSTLIGLVVVFALGFFLYNSVSSPLAELSKAAAAIGQGHLDTRIAIDTKDEVGFLADSFNRMAVDLSQTTVSKSYVDNIIKSMLDMLIVFDPDGTICKVNSSTLRLLGYTQEELLGKRIKQIILENEPGTSIINRLPDKGSMFNIETTFLSKHGNHIPVLLSGAVMQGERGEIEGFVCVARDIIDRKRAEVALQSANDDLEHRVQERTGELLEANKRLKQEVAQRKSTEAALRRSKSRLRQLSSHILSAREKERKRISMELHDDLGQSLSLLKVQINSFQDHLQSNQKPEPSDISHSLNYLDYIIENVRRLARDLSPSILEDLGLTAALKWLIDDCTKHYGLKVITEIENIDMFFPPEDQIIIYRIFQEILTNVGKHAKASMINVEITISGAFAYFSIKDNGRGFNTKMVSGKPCTEKGLGLTAMKERAFMLHSNLRIVSRMGQGTTIHFKTPYRERKPA